MYPSSCFEKHLNYFDEEGLSNNVSSNHWFFPPVASFCLEREKLLCDHKDKNNLQYVAEEKCRKAWGQNHTYIPGLATLKLLMICGKNKTLND